MFHNDCPDTGQIISSALSSLNNMEDEYTITDMDAANQQLQTSLQTHHEQQSSLTATSSAMESFPLPSLQQQVTPGQQKRPCDLDATYSDTKRQSSLSARDNSASSSVICASGSLQSNHSEMIQSSSESLQSRYHVTITNRFSELNNDESLDDSPVEASKIPPIFLYIEEKSKFSELIKAIKPLAKSEFFTDLRANKLKIQMSTIEDYRAVIKNFVDSEKQFHTYADPNNKKFSVVIKNLPPEITTEEIHTEIKQKYDSVLKVIRLQKNGAPIPVIAAEFSGLHPIENILQ